MERDLTVALTFLSELTLKNRHVHILSYIPKTNPVVNCIPIKALTDTFSGMSKKSARHKDGWTWELLRGAAKTDSTAVLLRRDVEHFSSDNLPNDFWAYLTSVLMYPIRKKLPEEKTSLTDPALRPVTRWAVLTRFGCKVLVRMNRVMVAEQLLMSH
jgi:hypothetical protein